MKFLKYLYCCKKFLFGEDSTIIDNKKNDNTNKLNENKQINLDEEVINLDDDDLNKLLEQQLHLE